MNPIHVLDHVLDHLWLLVVLGTLAVVGEWLVLAAVKKIVLADNDLPTRRTVRLLAAAAELIKAWRRPRRPRKRRHRYRYRK